MRHLVPITLATLAALACGGPKPAETSASPAAETAGGTAPETASEGAPAASDETAAAPAQSNEFVVRDSEGSDTAKNAEGANPSKIKPTKTEAALKFIVTDKDTGPIRGVVVSLTAPDGKKYYTEETDTKGYAEVLVPVGQKYELVYLSLGRKDIAASVPVSDAPNQSLRLTLRYKRRTPPKTEAGTPSPGIVLNGVTFDTGKATLSSESFPQFDNIVEYMTHKKSARIEISGHTDNVGNPKTNKALSQKRAQACRDYLISKGIEGSRIEAVGYGDERPLASNDTEDGRHQNRRIEATEL